MILDRGIATVTRKINVAQPGKKPIYEDALLVRGWFGELSFETAPARPTPNREDVRADARIRILQDRRITNHDRVTIPDGMGGSIVYEVTRAYHGTDDESGEPITDLTLEVVTP